MSGSAEPGAAGAGTAGAGPERPAAGWPAGRLVCWHYDHMALPLPQRHRYPRQKYWLVRERLLAEGTLHPDQLRRAEPEDWALLELAHTPDYLRALREETLDAAARREIGLPFSRALVDRARAAVHGTLAAALSALRHGAAGNLGGGTHHAFAGRGSGYCVVNDIAVAARYLQRHRMAERIAVVDLDVHQGNGTAAIFAGDPDVFTLSAHGERNWPYRKARSDLDLNLPDGTDDSGYLSAIAPPLEGLLADFRPEVVFFQAGADPLAVDRLGRLALSREGLRRRDALVLELCAAHGAATVVTLGGGYGVPIEETVEAHANTFRELARRMAPHAGAGPVRPATPASGGPPGSAPQPLAAASEDGTSDPAGQ